MTEKKLRSYIGTMDQLARIRTSVLDDGRGRGIRIADVDNGSGLRFTILLDRGMDIGDACFNGIPVAYQTPVGLVHPSYYGVDGGNWLRSFGGGLLTGCGLRHVGPPGDGHGLHGRLSHIPAEDVSISKGWKSGKYELSVSGTVREVSFFGENLKLRRTISTVMGRNAISISDEITNRGVRPSPLMILYHINAGFPLVSEASVVSGNVIRTEPRDENAAAGIDEWMACQPPTDGYLEQCFLHDVAADKDELARMFLRNASLGLSMEVACRKAELPCFTQWKMMGRQEYVVGIEPGNCYPLGQSGGLKVISPEETVENFVMITFHME